MTEQEWLTTKTAEEMIRTVVYSGGSMWDVYHRLQLFGAGCYRHVRDRVSYPLNGDDPSLEVVRTAELYALGAADHRSLDQATELWRARVGPWTKNDFAPNVVHILSLQIPQCSRHEPLEFAFNERWVNLHRDVQLLAGRIGVGPAPEESSHPDHPWHVAFQSAVAEADSMMADLLRCIIGNPFRPQTPFDPAWRTSTVVGIAKQIDETRTFGNLPILADALQDAGCEVAPVLDHCRGTHHHARGCWVLEQIFDRNRRPPTGPIRRFLERFVPKQILDRNRRNR